MRNAIYILLLFLTGCQTGPGFLINGQLPDKKYDGEKIYLVPFENAPIERVDSAVIVGGKFKFEGVVMTSEIYIIRAKPVLRYTLQELLVVKEPGIINAKIGKISSAGGTTLNDSLQQWKEKKTVSDYFYEDLKQQYKVAMEADKPYIKQKADSLNARIVNVHFNFVRNNRNNVAGKFVEKMMSGAFTPEQKKELSIQ